MGIMEMEEIVLFTISPSYVRLTSFGPSGSVRSTDPGRRTSSVLLSEGDPGRRWTVEDASGIKIVVRNRHVPYNGHITCRDQGTISMGASGMAAKGNTKKAVGILHLSDLYFRVERRWNVLAADRARSSYNRRTGKWVSR